MKHPFLAFFLSFLLPGAGLAYLGKWKWAMVNLTAVLLLGLILVLALPDDVFERYSQYVAMGLSGGSGGLAQTLAAQSNAKLESEKTAR